MATIIDAVLVLGVMTLLSGMAGFGDNDSDAMRFAAIGAGLTVVAALVRQRVTRPAHPVTRQVIAGIGILWVTLIVICAAIYFATGSLTNIADAVVEATAGLTTTAVTVLDVNEISRALLLWRATTSWVGGLLAILLAVVALPSAIHGTALLTYSSPQRGFDLVPNAVVGVYRVLAIYSGFTVICVLAYLATGLGVTDATVVGLGTVSTGGFAPRLDSLASYGTDTMLVATGAMTLAGASIFVLWWIVRGRTRPLLRSHELRFYALMILVVAVIITLTSNAGPLEALFTTASVVSTTGFAIADWTLWPSLAVALIIVAVGIGSMLGSPGGGVKVVRVQLLLEYIRRELRHQLNPRMVVLARRDGRPVGNRTLDRVGSYQITHVALIGMGAFVLGVTGLSVNESLWTSVSAMSTLGPAVGEIGAFGSLHDLPQPTRLALVPLMLAGRVAILPLLAVLSAVLSWRVFTIRWARRVSWKTSRRIRSIRRHHATPTEEARGFDG